MTNGARTLPDELALICSACGTRSVDPLRFSCPARVRGDDIDHVLVPPEPLGVPWPAEVQRARPDPAAGCAQPAGPAEPAVADPVGTDPFLRYRTLLYGYRLHRAWGGDDTGFVALVQRLQEAVTAIDGRPFRITPLRRFEGAELAPSPAPSLVWVKDETINVAGSHKGRHFMGLALYLSIVELHCGKPAAAEPALAISSCGNAALAATVLARAMGRRIEVFVPPDAAPSVLARLETMGAIVQRCPRVPGRAGDPCQAAFEACVEQGAVPFSAQGPSNGLALDGAATLGYELADQWRAQVRAGPAPDECGSHIRPTTADDTPVDAPPRLYVQVGGGGLASSVMTGLRRARAREVIPALPALHTVQARSAAPFTRALEAVLGRGGGDATAPAVLADVLSHFARHRSEAMQPWPDVPVSVAGGILDDETYDWRTVAEAVCLSGGRSVLASEQELIEANRRARLVTGIDVDYTGSAGLAGVWAAATAEAGTGPTEAPVLVLFTGARR